MRCSQKITADPASHWPQTTVESPSMSSFSWKGKWEPCQRSQGLWASLSSYIPQMEGFVNARELLCRTHTRFNGQFSRQLEQAGTGMSNHSRLCCSKRWWCGGIDDVRNFKKFSYFQSNSYQMLFLPPNQHYQSNESKNLSISSLQQLKIPI